MFSTKEQLIKKTGKHGIGRLSFLEQLVNEYKTTKSRDHKQQVLANLANFAYDPVNYEFLRRLKVLELFMITLEDSNPKLVEFAIGGICNISVEPYSREYILRNHGVRLISNLLSRSEEHIVISALTTLLYLDTKQSKKEIASPENVKQIQKFANGTNKRLKNLALIFLEEYCGIKATSTSNHATESNKQTSTITSTAASETVSKSDNETLSAGSTIAVNTSASGSKRKRIVVLNHSSTSQDTSDSTGIDKNTESAAGPSTSTAPFKIYL